MQTRRGQLARKKSHARLSAASSTSLVSSIMDMVQRKKKVEITDDLLRRTKTILPPEVPEPIDGIGKRDLSTYTCTWYMNGTDTVVDPELPKFWLPKGYDLYIISVQQCRNEDRLAQQCLDFLDDGEDSYALYTQFTTVRASPGAREHHLAILLLAHRSLIEENVFKTSKLTKKDVYTEKVEDKRFNDDESFLGVFAMQNNETETAGAIALQFDIFDSTFVIVNVQLASGIGNTKRRLTDLEDIIAAIGTLRADHVLLMGYFGSTFFGDGVGNKLSSYVPLSYKNDDGWGTRFTTLMKYDEVLEQLIPNVRGMSEFEEMPIHFPPTSGRKIRKPLPKPETMAVMFHNRFNLESLYDYKPKHIPAYSDRIFWKSFDRGLKPCILASVTGTCEGITSSNHVPMFTAFRFGNKSFGTVTNPVDVVRRIAAPVKLTDLKAAPPQKQKVALKPPKRRTMMSSQQAYDELSKKVKSKRVAGSKIQAGGLYLDMNKAFSGSQKSYSTEDRVESIEEEDEEFEIVMGSRNQRALESEVKSVATKPIETAGMCARCNKTIEKDSQYFEASGRLFHSECFTCSHCDTPVRDKYYLVNDSLFCEKDYKGQFATACQICKEPMRSQGIRTSKGSYHAHCFACSECYTPLAEIDGDGFSAIAFMYRDDKLYCQAHGTETEEEACFTCNKPTSTGDSLKLHDKAHDKDLLVHKKCFKCERCKKNLSKSDFRLKGAKLYCSEHGELKCKGCDEEIESFDEYFTVHKFTFHVECQPKCDTCNKEVHKIKSLVRMGDDLVCSPCMRDKRRVQRNETKGSVIQSGPVLKKQMSLDGTMSLQTARKVPMKRRDTLQTTFSFLPPPPERKHPSQVQDNDELSDDTESIGSEDSGFNIDDDFEESYAAHQLAKIQGLIASSKSRRKSGRKKSAALMSREKSTDSSFSYSPPPPPFKKMLS